MKAVCALLLLLASGTLRAGEFRFLALGDSYTIGESVSAGERWPSQFADALRKLGLHVAAPQVIAQTGWTTADLLENLRAQNPRGPFDLVTLMIGVNDQFQGRSLAEYRADFETLLTRAVALADGKKERVIVLSIPDYSVTPFGRNYQPARSAREVAAFNQACRDATEKARVSWLDVTGVSLEAKNDASLVAGDGLHPSAKMHAAWAGLLRHRMAAMPAFTLPVAKPR